MIETSRIGLRVMYWIFSLSCMCIASCTQQQGNTVFTKISPDQSGIRFSNRLTYTDTLTVLDFEYMFNGAGVALLDVNQDGLLDIFLSGNMVSSKLYLNKGNLKFEDITEKAGLTTKGWSYGVSIVDINQDGYPDIYLCKAGSRRTAPAEMENQFFINNKDNSFTDRAAEMGLNSNGYDVQAAFFDYDKDGDLDMYLLKNAFVNYNRNTARSKMLDGAAASTDRLFRNDGNLKFTDVSQAAGITIEGFGLGVSICDLNEDGWPDIYVSNDFLTNDLLWINNQHGGFSNLAPSVLRHETYNGMGNDVADYNNDGHEDVLVVDMLPPDNKRWKLTMRGNTYEEFQNALKYSYEPQYVRNTLQLNNGDGSFSEIGQLAGIHATEWSWAPLFADYNNDGYKDLLITNGYRQDITNLDFIKYGKKANFVGTPEANRKERLDELKKYPGIKVHNYLYENNRDLTFTDVSAAWGMLEDSYANGAAYGDLDNDGDLDLVINNLDEEASLYENNSNKLFPQNNWLRLGFKGPAGNSNGIGVKAYIWQGGKFQYQYLSPYRGYLSTVEPFLHFGLSGEPVDSLKIIWPNGRQQMLKNTTTRQLLWISYTDAADQQQPAIAPKSSLFQRYTAIPEFLHQEDDYVDFKLQALLPKNYSHEGPGISVADINGDGLEDFFIGAAAQHQAQYFLQQRNGSFTSGFLPDSNRSDNMGSLLFDADQDGDPDLFVASGGTMIQKNNDPVYRHHFYVNTGKGNFQPADGALPEIIGSAASVAGADFDRDGDIDLFIGGRIRPGEYPLSPKSFLLRNDSRPGGPKFTDISSAAGQDLSDLGMVTSAIWTDFDNDEWVDLVIAGEYMPIRFFKNQQGKLKEVTESTGLHQSNGWWNSLAAGDFDKDGDIDYVAGNLGYNSPYKASAKEPICVYANDFDKDGKIDPVLCHYVDGVEQVFHARDDINRQMLPFRARFRTYEAYANASFREAFRQDEIAAAKVLKAETMGSAYLENLGNGKFRMRDLPVEAQMAPLYAMVAEDFDGDGNLDLLATGNSYATEVQTGRYDALGTLLLKGDGKGNWKADKNALHLQYDNKSIVRLSNAAGKMVLLISANADSLRAVTVKATPKTISTNSDDAYAIISDQSGKQFRQEFYYGSSYLSQSSRRLVVPATTRAISIVSYTGKKRTVQP